MTLLTEGIILHTLKAKETENIIILQKDLARQYLTIFKSKLRISTNAVDV